MAIRTDTHLLRRQVPAVAGAVVLLAATTTLTNRLLPAWSYPLAGLVAALGLLAVARWSGLSIAQVGLDRRHLRRAAVVGLIGLALVGLVFGAALVIPTFRAAFHDGRVDTGGVDALLWAALVRIPLGTVLLEEIAFRGVLPALFGADDRWRWRPVLAASGLFGLWHVLPSLALRQNAAVAGLFGHASVFLVSAIAVLASAAAGVVLYWWRHTGRGVLAPALVHLATNSGGVLIAWWVLTGG